jgi:lysozyme
MVAATLAWTTDDVANWLIEAARTAHRLPPVRVQGHFNVWPTIVRTEYERICPAGYWTIGYGRLCDPKHPPISVEEGDVYLAHDLMTAANATLRYCPVLATEPDSRLAAIVDFTFNLGAGRLQTSTLRRRINQRDWLAAGTELRRWVFGGGKVLPGLVARREAEAAWLLHNPRS